MRHKLFSYLRNQNGVTLIEMLASVTIFVLIFIPLTSVYIKGVQIYNTTEKQTALRNEADFVIGDIMRTVQDATYFELKNSTNRDSQSELLSIFRNPKAGSLITNTENDSLFADTLVVYKRTNQFDSASGTTHWMLTRENFQFALPPGASQIDHLFNHSQNYMVDGLFRLSADSKSLTLYLIVAPFGEPQFDQDGQQTLFQTHDDILAELNRTETSGRVNSYIRIVQTNFAVSNVRSGE